MFDPATGIVHLMIQQGDDGVIYTTSPDGGVTWTPPANITVSGNFANIIPGVGHGLAIDPQHCMDPTCAGTAGRLLMPWACTVEGPVSNDTACSSECARPRGARLPPFAPAPCLTPHPCQWCPPPPAADCRTCLLASDDNGAGWYLAAVSSQVGGRESALVQLNSADFSTMGAVVYASERNLGPAPGVRLHAVSLDGGASFDSRYYAVDTDLPDVLTTNWTGVVSGLARVSAPSAPDFLVFTAPYNNVSERANLTAFVSSGVGPSATWSVSAIGSLWSADAAYSDTLQINDTHLGVLFECGSNGDFAAQIAFAAVPVASLL